MTKFGDGKYMDFFTGSVVLTGLALMLLTFGLAFFVTKFILILLDMRK